MASALKTTDHKEIQHWAEKRGGRPAIVHLEGKGGILRLDFGTKDENLEEISWEEFFNIFDDRELAFLHQDRTAEGATSRFFKFVNRE